LAAIIPLRRAASALHHVFLTLFASSHSFARIVLPKSLQQIACRHSRNGGVLRSPPSICFGGGVGIPGAEWRGQGGSGRDRAE